MIPRWDPTTCWLATVGRRRSVVEKLDFRNSRVTESLPTDLVHWPVPCAVGVGMTPNLEIAVRSQQHSRHCVAFYAYTNGPKLILERFVVQNPLDPRTSCSWIHGVISLIGEGRADPKGPGEGQEVGEQRASGQENPPKVR